ncbi:MAG: PASTA domain-containing protein [Ginsengibacter sp.]
MFKFITRQPFWVNFLAAIVALFLLGFLILQSLSWFTNHGSYLKVPSVTGKKVDDAVRFLEKEGFEVVITDSAFNDSMPLNTVKKQIPAADATVKVNRTVFLNINPVILPLVEMPRLEGLSYRFALENLHKNHLKLGDTTYRADFMKGSILEQNYKGNKILPGTKLRWGSAVDLVIGGGLVEQQIRVPDLLGLTVSEAKVQLQAKGLLLAAVLTTGPVTDTLNSFVVKQNPDALDEEQKPAYIQPGQTMDIWVSVNPPEIDSLKQENQLQIP